MRNEAEIRLKQAVAKYLQANRMLYRFDVAADIPLPIGIARKSKRIHGHRRGWPDLIIFEPFGRWHGLAIELKAEGVRVWTKDGRPATPHIAEQRDMLIEFERRGWAAGFVQGIDEFLFVMKAHRKGCYPFKFLRVDGCKSENGFLKEL